MQDDLEEILFDARTIARRIRTLGARIREELAADGVEDDPSALTLVPILSGSLVFTADLIRQLPWRLRLRMVSVSAYPGARTRSTDVELGDGFSELGAAIAGRHVLVIDDILDTGRTLEAVREALARHRPRSVRTCVLLHKKGRQTAAIEPDYVGFEVPDRFVVGYGLDYDGLYRNLPMIATLRPERLAPRTCPP